MTERIWKSLAVATSAVCVVMAGPIICRSNALALIIQPTSLTFNGTQGETNPVGQAVNLRKSGDRLKAWSLTTNASWLSVSPASGTIANETDQIVVNVNISGIAPGSYPAMVTIITTGPKGGKRRDTLPVNLTISSQPTAPSISLSPPSLSFTGVAGGAAPAGQSFNLTNPSGGTLTWTVADNAAWLSVNPASGTTTTESDSIPVTVNTGGLAAGNYSATISVSATAAKNSPLAVPVSLTLTAPAASPTPSIGVSPPSLSFSGATGGVNPPSKSLSITNTGASTLTWTLNKNANWLTLNMTSGTTMKETDNVVAGVNTAGLAPGTYNATITLTANGSTNSPRQVPVTLTIMSAATSSAALSWSANAESDLAGYKVYIGTMSGVYSPPVSVGKVTTYIAGNLKVGSTYFFSVTAYDGSGNESVHSPEVTKSIY
ncbi:MAG: BACON domain-containing protein [Nitrospiraceae bacterium]